MSEGFSLSREGSYAADLKGAVTSDRREENRYFRWQESEAEGYRKWAAEAKIALASQLI
jgi:hypothetical protein